MFLVIMNFIALSYSFEIGINNRGIECGQSWGKHSKTLLYGEYRIYKVKEWNEIKRVHDFSIGIFQQFLDLHKHNFHLYPMFGIKKEERRALNDRAITFDILAFEVAAFINNNVLLFMRGSTFQYRKGYFYLGLFNLNQFEDDLEVLKNGKIPVTFGLRYKF
jgi:hypothetical protein